MKSSQPGNTTGTPIKIEDPNQFVPLNTNPTEVLDKRNRVSFFTTRIMSHKIFKFKYCQLINDTYSNKPTN